MKNKWLAIAGAVTAMAMTTAVQANPINPFGADNVEVGQSTLASSSTAGSDVTIFWGVDLSVGIYTYDYQIYDTSSDIVDALNVAFSTLGIGALIAGNYTTSDPNSVTWNLGGLYVSPGGTSGTLYFTSLLPPSLGNANAQDANPPSPWASVPGGQPVPVPAVPDGGLTVALLGLAFAGVEGMRRKLRK